MGVIAVGMSMLLLVTFTALHRVSATPSPPEPAAVTAPPTTVQPLAIHTPTPASSPMPQQSPVTPAPVGPTVTTVAPVSIVEPTLVTGVAPTTDEPVQEEQSIQDVAAEEIVVEEDLVEDVAEIDAASDEPPIDEIEETGAAEGMSEPAAMSSSAEIAVGSEVAPTEEMASEDDGDAAFGWDDAIRTPEGGVMGVITAGVLNVRAAPTLDAEAVGEVYARWPVTIYGETTGDVVKGTDVWYRIDAGGYVSAAFVEPFIPSTPDVTWDGAWVDVSLSENYAVAYDGGTPVYAAIVMTGKPGFETPTGAFTIYKRVESETLDSATVGIPEGDPDYYYLTDVAYTQYFATDGIALHSNYWSEPWEFGSSTSHGCVNLMEADAAWFWWFLSTGSIVNVRE